ncbi:hypothetical protein DFH27DRAFT_155163 [Peziza echinospora]|nr:hypothetical protein DFH27DRAFT_155163 [Peziza echinospora]
MGLPMWKKPEEPREVCPVAARRSTIRRRGHHHRHRLTDPYHRTDILERDRRTSQQVLFDLLQFTQGVGGTSSGSSSSGSSSVSSPVQSSAPLPNTVPAPPETAPSASTSRIPPQREYIGLPSLSQAENDRLNSGAFMFGPPIIGSRFFGHPTFDLAARLQREQREREQQLESLAAATETTNNQPATAAAAPASVHGDLQFTFDPFRGATYSHRMGPPFPREDERSSYERESSRLPRHRMLNSSRTSEMMEGLNQIREQMRSIGAPVRPVDAPSVRPVEVPDAASRRRAERGWMVDGLGDRDRSLSPDMPEPPWDLLSGSALDGMHHCDFMSDSDDDENDDDDDDDDDEEAPASTTSHTNSATAGGSAPSSTTSNNYNYNNTGESLSDLFLSGRFPPEAARRLRQQNEMIDQQRRMLESQFLVMQRRATQQAHQEQIARITRALQQGQAPAAAAAAASVSSAAQPQQQQQQQHQPATVGIAGVSFGHAAMLSARLAARIDAVAASITASSATTNNTTSSNTTTTTAAALE